MWAGGGTWRRPGVRPWPAPSCRRSSVPRPSEPLPPSAPHPGLSLSPVFGQIAPRPFTPARVTCLATYGNWAVSGSPLAPAPGHLLGVLHDPFGLIPCFSETPSHCVSSFRAFGHIILFLYGNVLLFNSVIRASRAEAVFNVFAASRFPARRWMRPTDAVRAGRACFPAQPHLGCPPNTSPWLPGHVHWLCTFCFQDDPRHSASSCRQHHATLLSMGGLSADP